MSGIENVLRSTLLAAIIFWSILLSGEQWSSYMVGVVIMSVIPIFICCAVVISISILPFFFGTLDSSMASRAIFRRWFPYYVTIAFGLCLWVIITTNFQKEVIAFFISAFITTCQSWVWFAKSKSHETTT